MEEALVLSKFDSLVQSGLILYDDKQETIEQADGELKFHFILTSALAKKPTLHSPTPQASPQPKPNQPPPRPGSDISTTNTKLGPLGTHHVLAANKFSYARPHLLLLTASAHQRQWEPLDERDLTAALTCLNAATEQDYVVFYNCGHDAGCSRLHKHMQLLPLPKATFAAFLDCTAEGAAAPSVPFAWFYRRFGEQRVTPAAAAGVYNELLAQAEAVGRGRAEHADDAPPGAACPHNVVLTRRWMVVVPRRRAGVNEEAGANALGMLGWIAVASEKEIDTWRRLGLRETLAQLGLSRD